jgi:hypothetical protein
LRAFWYQWFVAIFEDDPGDDPEGWRVWAEELHEIDWRWRPELDERDIDPTEPRSPAAQRRVAEFLMERGRVGEFLRAQNVRLKGVQMEGFLAALEGEFLAAMRLLARRANRDFRRDTRPDRFPEWTPQQAPKVPANGTLTPTLTGILEGWWKEAQAAGRKPSTYECYRATTEAIVAFLGHDDARRVTADDVVRFKDHRLSTINPRTGKPISAKTVKDSDLSGLKTLFGGPSRTRSWRAIRRPASPSSWASGSSSGARASRTMRPRPSYLRRCIRWLWVALSSRR